MSRPLPPRRRRSSSSGQLRFKPLVAFLLVASFGILFAGCSSVSGPGKEDLTDSTFTATDIAHFNELAASSSSMTGGSTSVGANEPVVLSMSGASGVSAGLPEAQIDTSMAPVYSALRTVPKQGGESQYVVDNSILNLRDQPSAKGKLLRVMSEGDPLTLVKWENGEWAQVEIPGGTKGYVTTKYLAKVVSQDALEKERKAFENMYYVSFAFVNVRKEPNQASEKIGEIPGKQLVKPLKIEGTWAQVDLGGGKTGWVSTDYLTKFAPRFIVRQVSYAIPVLRYAISDDQSLQTLVAHMNSLKQRGVQVITFSDLGEKFLSQDKKGTTIGGRMVVLAVTNVTSQNARKISDALTSNGLRGTLFVQTKDVGISGITQKTLLTLIANGLDVQSGGHTGDDLRALTNAQVKLELQQSRKILEDAMSRSVFAIDYPQGGVNDRIEQLAAESAYLFGVGPSSSKTFTRADLLDLPSVTVTGVMTADDLLRLLP